MFSPLPKTPLSAVKAADKRRHSGFGSPSARKTLTPGLQNVSFGPSFMESSLNMTNNKFECFASDTPVLVIEALLAADRISDVSVKIEPFGYASLVCGRQLLIWKFASDKNIIHCKELTLPPSDLAHKADLVHLFQSEDSNLLSALAVSPEGHVRYWPNINHEGSSIDSQPDLQGQECCSLTSVWPLGCVLATTSSSLVILTPTIGEGQPSIVCHPLAMPVGVITGIGRKFSSFIFGSIPSQTAEMKQLSRVLSIPTGGDEYVLYVLSMNSLQKWQLAKKDGRENSDKLIFNVDLESELKRHFSKNLLNNDSLLIPSLKTFCLDVQPCQSGVIILAVGTKLENSTLTAHFAFCLINTNSSTTPQEFSKFYLTNFQVPYQKETEEIVLSYKLLLPSIESSLAYIYNHEKAFCFQYESSLENFESFDFSNANRILGSGVFEEKPLFFINSYGIVTLNPSNETLSESKLVSSKDMTIQPVDAFQGYSHPVFEQFLILVLLEKPNESPESLSAKLRTAMCSHYNGNKETCDATMKEISASFSSKNDDLDNAIVALSLNIIDDYPASDPRWCESVPQSSVSQSLIISYQLGDKLTVHNFLINFLETYHLFSQLKTTKIEEHKIPTKLMLLEHKEKILAAKTIRTFLSDHNDVIECAVQDALDRRNIAVKNHLTPQDVFFREVSTFHTIFPSILSWEEEQLNTDDSASSKLNAILAVNKIFVGILECINEFRNETEMYKLQQELTGDFLPWTSREGSSGIRSHIRSQLEMNVNHTLDIGSDIQIKGVLYQQYVVMLDFYLKGYRSQIASIKKEQKKSLMKEFASESSKFLGPLVEVGQYERAAALAEEYLAFDILLEVCEKSQNVDRLQRYMLQFAEHNFSEFVFKWYVDRGQKGKLFERNLGQRDALGKFLQGHEELKWLYFIQEENYSEAYATLKELAFKETEFLGRKKTLLSLSKICALLSDVPFGTKANQLEAINFEHDLITHQEALPISVVETFGIDPRNMRVFTPQELIDMYIAEENTTANAYDFKIALDLLIFMKKAMDDPEVNNIRRHIWAKAVLRDNWDALDTNNPMDAIKEAIFFQIIELACDQGIDIHDFMPPLDDLLQDPELVELSENPSFRFLIRAGYEYVLKIVS